MRNNKSLFNKNMIFIVLIIIVFSATGIIIHGQLKADDITLKIENKENIAVSFNISIENQLLLSELIIIDTQTKNAAIFNIPANYGSILESISRIDRLDILYDYENPEIFISQLENITEIGIDYYINIEMDNLVKAVDMLSGLEMFIPNPVEVTESGIPLLLPSGSSVLDGEKIVILLLNESDDINDADLIGRWHKFMQSFLKQAGEESGIFDNKKTFELFYSYFKTDLRKDSLRSLINLFSFIDSDQLVFQRIIGDKKDIDGQQLLFPYYGGSLLKETVKQTLTAIANEIIPGDEEIQIKIEIQNGTGIPGLAGRTSHFFNNLGYNVVSIKNADRNDYEKTTIITDSNNALSAQKVASLIRCANIENMELDNSASDNAERDFRAAEMIDVILILGKDFDGRYCR